MKKILILFLCTILFACNQQNTKVVLETDGIEYHIMNNVSFYYPKDFSIDLTTETQEKVSMLKDDEAYMYQTIIDDTDNKIKDMPQLYLGQLEEDGAVKADYTSVVLENELECYEFSGIYASSGIKFKHLVYFTNQATYVYSYQASEKIFDDHINIATQYLRSLTVHNEQVS